MLRFNSTTVQLILKRNWKYGYVFMFQFHNGTINTLTTVAHTIYPILFQFHNGTINTSGNRY